MKRIEPNLLLAAAAALPLALLVLTATVFGAPGQGVKYAVIAVVCPVAFVLLNGLMRRGKPGRPPMIHPEAPSTIVWAALFPGLIMLMALIPALFPGHDYGLLVLIAGIFMGLTLESAWKARRS